jgi:hypothetical protein
MTYEVLSTICAAIWPDENLQYVLNFQREIGGALTTSGS